MGEFCPGTGEANVRSIKRGSFRTHLLIAAVLLAVSFFALCSAAASQENQAGSPPAQADCGDLPRSLEPVIALPDAGGREWLNALGPRALLWRGGAWSLPLLLLFGRWAVRYRGYMPVFRRHIVTCVGTHAPPCRARVA